MSKEFIQHTAPERTLRPETQQILAKHDLYKTRSEINFAHEHGVSLEEVQEASKRYLQPEQLENQPFYQDIKLRAHEDARRLYEQSAAPLTPFDRYTTQDTVSLPPEQTEQILINRALLLRVMNSPERMKAARYTLENKPFTPPSRDAVESIEIQLSQQTLGTFEDFGLMIPDAEDFRISRSALLGVGLWTRGTTNRVCGPYGGSSMPDCSNSPLAISTMAMAGGLAFVPRDAELSDIGNQANLVSQTMHMLEDQPFPFIEGTDTVFARDMWQKNVVGLIETNPYKALKRTEALYNRGVRTVRPYSPEGGIENDFTVRAIKSEFGDEVDVLAGMVTSSDNAKRLVDAGANGIVIGIGGGGICRTPTEAGLAFASLKILYDCKKAGLAVPVVMEGGIGRTAPIVFSLGASVIAKSQALFGGTLEQPGGPYYYKTNGKLVKPYGGEASDRTRYLSQRPQDITGRQLFREGDERYTAYDELTPSMLDNMWLLQQSLCTALVFARSKSIQNLHENPPEIFHLSANNQNTASVHHPI